MSDFFNNTGTMDDPGDGFLSDSGITTDGEWATVPSWEEVRADWYWSQQWYPSESEVADSEIIRFTWEADGTESSGSYRPMLELGSEEWDGYGFEDDYTIRVDTNSTNIRLTVKYDKNTPLESSGTAAVPSAGAHDYEATFNNDTKEAVLKVDGTSVITFTAGGSIDADYLNPSYLKVVGAPTDFKAVRMFGNFGPADTPP